MILIHFFLVEKFLIMLTRWSEEQYIKVQEYSRLSLPSVFILLYDTHHVFYFSSYKYI